jgi:hypothetical protein
MQNIRLICFLFLLLPSLQAFAFDSSHFKGWYEVLSRRDLSPSTKQYLLVDVDRLEVLWARYVDAPFPPDLEQYRSEPSILAAFTERDLSFFLLERSALISNDYLAFSGANGDRFELKRRADGKFDLGVRDKDRVSIYLLAAPRQTPESR